MDLQYDLESAILISDLSLTVEAGSHEIKFWRHSGGFDRFVRLLDDVLWYDYGVQELPYPPHLLVSEGQLIQHTPSLMDMKPPVTPAIESSLPFMNQETGTGSPIQLTSILSVSLQVL